MKHRLQKQQNKQKMSQMDKNKSKSINHQTDAAVQYMLISKSLPKIKNKEIDAKKNYLKTEKWKGSQEYNNIFLELYKLMKHRLQKPQNKQQMSQMDKNN